MTLGHRSAFAVSLGALAICLLAATCGGEEKNEPRRAQLLEQMRRLAKETKVEFAKGESRIELVKEPVFRYDDQPRRFIDATMWAWTDNGRPVAFQKIEARELGDKTAPSAQWQYCFASLSPDLLVAQWPEDRRFRSTEPGVVFRPLAEAPTIAKSTVQRKRQSRELARKFSARIITDPRNQISQEMRLLTTPIFEYPDPDTKELRGAVYGLSTNGTNPDLLILLEIRDEKEKPAWHFAPARMTTGGVTLRYGEAKVWECEWVDSRKVDLKTWAFFVTPREPLREPGGEKP